jgi:hypothetical protein
MLQTRWDCVPFQERVGETADTQQHGCAQVKDRCGLPRLLQGERRRNRVAGDLQVRGLTRFIGTGRSLDEAGGR